MPIEKYAEYFYVTAVAMEVKDWYSDHFLKLNDPGEGNGTHHWCGASCTRRELTLTSAETQDVYVTVHTWDKRALPNQCEKDHWSTN